MIDSSLQKLPDPSAKAEVKEIEKHYQELSGNRSIKNLLDALPEAVMILNQYRQVVFINKTSLETFGISDREIACGLRPGEVLLCNHSDETVGGCGTTDFCRFCGANISILSSQIAKETVKECRITQKSTGTALDLKVKAAPFEVNGELFTIFSIQNISDEKRREVLQRIFFHDILNTAGGLSGYSELLLDAPAAEIDEYKTVIYSLSLKIIDEINSQKQLIAAENGTLDVCREEASSIEALKEVILACKRMQSATNKNIILDANAENVSFRTDINLLSRVLWNLIKNALEASDENQSILVGCRQIDQQVEFYVNNQAVMPDSVKYQVFQRSFSTKGNGRGLGTYSIKLLTESYLKGSVRFESNAQSGTTFYARYPII